MLRKTFKIIESNHKPNSAKSHYTIKILVHDICMAKKPKSKKKTIIHRIIEQLDDAQQKTT